MEKFKVGDKVVVTTLDNLTGEEMKNWALHDNLELNKIYIVSQINSDGWLEIKGKRFGHHPNRFKLANKNTFKVGDRVVAIGASFGIAIGREYPISGVRDGSVLINDYWYVDTLFELAKTETNNTPHGLLPFNYEEAIKDLSRVVTRDGRKVTEMFKLNTIISEKTICAVTEGVICWYDFNGRVNEYIEYGLDLFLKQPETLVYVNVYEEKKGLLGFGYESIEEAKKNKTEGAIYISKITFTPTGIKTETVHKY